MKTYVLIVSEKFPKTHKRAGEPTNFPLSIKHYDKIHTIRGNFDLWKKRFDQIEAGNAVLSIRVWSGKPYRSEQQEIFRFDKTRGIGIEKLTFKNGLFNFMLVNGEYCFPEIECDVAKNDGLSYDDFEDWFKGADFSKPMAIIHFTKYRYSKQN